MKLNRIGTALMAGMFLFSFSLAGCAKAEQPVPAITLQFDDEGTLPQFHTPKDDDEVALICTSKGNILIRFCPEGAPKAVENFITHAKNGYYDGLKFHRTIDGFMIQGGDPKGDGSGGESIWGGGFALELTDDLYHFRGALCMAHSSLPDSNGSQFYIVQGNIISEDIVSQMNAAGFPEPVIKKYQDVGGYPPLDQGYTVFGMVLGGMDAVDAIAAMPTTDDNGTAADPVVMTKVMIMPYREAKAAAGK